MRERANPTKRTELLDERSVLKHRRLFCPEYDDCLQLAADGHWTSWSCEACPFAGQEARAGAAVESTPAVH